MSRPAAAVRTLQATQPGVAPTLPDAMDALVDEAMAGWRQQMQPIVAPLEVLFARAEREGWSAAELIEALTPTLSQPHDAQLTEQLARAAYTARLAGVHGLEDAPEPPAPPADAADGR